MGVHPGCPVCSIVAASLVAVETDVGETISAANVAFVCGLWSIGVVALLSVISTNIIIIRLHITVIRPVLQVDALTTRPTRRSMHLTQQVDLSVCQSVQLSPCTYIQHCFTRIFTACCTKSAVSGYR